MNDDDHGGRGLSGAAGYMLGRMAADSDHDRTRFYERVRQRFARPVRAPYDADDVESAITTWKAAVQRRDHTIARLQAQLNDASGGYETLRQHYAEVYEENNHLREQIARHGHDIGIMLAARDERIARLEAEIARIKRNS